MLITQLSTPDNLFPPLRYGSPTVGQRSHPNRVSSRAGTPQDTRPGTSCSILTDGRVNLIPSTLYSYDQTDIQGTPSKRYPAVSFTTPTGPADFQRTHFRSASNTPRKCTPPATTTRNRLPTVQSSTNTFGTPSPRVVARGYALSSASTVTATDLTPRGVPQMSLTQPSTSPKPKGRHRRKPSALKLRTTNLEPPAEISPGTPTPTPDRCGKSALGCDTTGGGHITPLRDGTPYSVSATTRRTEHIREKRRSRSTGDISSLVQRQGQHRVSQSESNALLDIEMQNRARDAEICTPTSMLSALSTPMSDMTISVNISPDKSSISSSSTPSPSSRFENVPLPWSTCLLSTLESELTDTYLTENMYSLLGEVPYILAPHTLASLSSEQTRLRLELERLRVKHTRISQHRDKLISRALANPTSNGQGVDEERRRAVQDTVARVDRVARQIYICNDQLRQMEVMKRDHECGVLLWALSRSSTSELLVLDNVLVGDVVYAQGSMDSLTR